MKNKDRILKQTSLSPRDAALISNGKFTERDIFLICKNSTDKFKFVQPIGMELYFIDTESFLNFINTK